MWGTMVDVLDNLHAAKLKVVRKGYLILVFS